MTERQLAESRTVELVRSPEYGFGFSIVGGEDDVPEAGKPPLPIIITRVRPGSPAQQAGLLVGTVVVGINKSSLLGLKHSSVVTIFKLAPERSAVHVRDTVTLSTTGAMGSYLPARAAGSAQLLVPVAFERVEALHAFRPTQPDELALEKGDIVHVTRKGLDGWGYGENQRTRALGLFPGNFVMRLRSARPQVESLYASLDSSRVEPLYASLDDATLQAQGSPSPLPLASPSPPALADRKAEGSSGDYATALRMDDSRAGAGGEGGAGSGARAVAAEAETDKEHDSYAEVKRPVYAVVARSRRPSADVPVGEPYVGPVRPDPVAEQPGAADPASDATAGPGSPRTARAGLAPRLKPSVSVRERAQQFGGLRDGEDVRRGSGDALPEELPRGDATHDSGEQPYAMATRGQPNPVCCWFFLFVPSSSSLSNFSHAGSSLHLLILLHTHGCLPRPGHCDRGPAQRWPGHADPCPR